MNREFILTEVTLFIFIAVATASCSQIPLQTPTPTQAGNPTPPSDFVTISDGKFMLEGRPYYFVGANFWQGMNLGVDGAKGDRALLVAELDRLQRIGVTNLRVMGSSEGPNTEPDRMVPALMVSPGIYDIDESTIAIIASHANDLMQVKNP